ncbi:MAG: hypothetical protein GY868_07895 [Deltaproteobacteria bacterium]|nr:hypothetical protein [Deltaproteobacteria bacterium]
MTCAGHVAAWSVDQLEVVFDRRSQYLHDAVHGIDLSPVSPAGCRLPAIRFDHEFGDHTNDTNMVKSALYQLIEKAGALLRKQRLAARVIRLIIDYSDGRRNASQAPARPATANDFSLFTAAEFALKRAWTRRTRIRSLCLQCDRLTFPPAQLELFADPKTEKTGNLFYALDMIRNKFGQSSICMGRTLLASSYISKRQGSALSRGLFDIF